MTDYLWMIFLFRLAMFIAVVVMLMNPHLLFLQRQQAIQGHIQWFCKGVLDTPLWFCVILPNHNKITEMHTNDML